MKLPKHSQIHNKKDIISIIIDVKMIIGGDSMQLQLESARLEDYLQEIDGVIDFKSPLIKETINSIKEAAKSDRERAELAFTIARDRIAHSFDTKSKVITISAEDAMAKKEGICFAKSHLLAALLRGMGIPAGFCYQRVLRKGTIESGYALHGLNALYLEGHGWFRVDPRGNKEGIRSEFSIEEEKLAYPIREELGEKDYPNVLTKPLESVINAMHESEDCHALFFNRPETLSV